VTRPAVRVSGIGIAHFRGDDPQEAADVRGRRLQAVLQQGASPVRLVHPIEEVTFLAAHEALTQAGISTPVSDDGIGIALGVEEGIDGIKARYYQGILRDGPLGASPMAFPLTTPNTVAARVSILFDLRGESVTLCGGSLSGAHALGLAVQTLRAGQAGAMLAGGMTAVEQEFLDALHRTGRSKGGDLGGGACLFLLEPEASDRSAGAAVRLLGYAEGFGKTDLLDAIQACLDDAGIVGDAVGSVRTASVHDTRVAMDALRQIGVTAAVAPSAMAGWHSASFPLAIAEAIGQPASKRAVPVLVLGSDCLVGAAAAIVQGEA
jgi:3-oxoacyl-(acyl-carrier-protein) synthase